MNLIQLTCFKNTVESGGVSAAAKKLFVTQPAVSKQLKLLEDELESKLFYKKNGRLFLTHEGRIVYRHSLAILGKFDELKDELNDAKGVVEGSVSIGCGPMTSRFILPELIQKSLKLYPKLRLSILETVATEIYSLLKRNAIDLGISSKIECKDEGIAYEELYQDDLVMICSLKNKLAKCKKFSIMDAGKYPFIFYTKGNEIRHIIDSHVNLGQPQHFLETGNTETIIQYVKRDLGISLIPNYIVKTLTPGDIAVRPLDLRLSVSFGISYHAGKYRPRAIQVLTSLTRDYYQNNTLFKPSF